jgi:hypothetical protein
LDAGMKDKLMILSLKKAFEMKKETNGKFSFIFDATKLSDEDKKDLIQNPLNFNITVTYKEI